MWVLFVSVGGIRTLYDDRYADLWVGYRTRADGYRDIGTGISRKADLARNYFSVVF